MSDRKPHQFRPPLYHERGASTGAENGSGSGRNGAPPSRDAGKAKPKEGWEAYRRWLSRVNSPGTKRRTAPDPSLYSWKGYHNWAEKAKQAFDPEQ